MNDKDERVPSRLLILNNMTREEYISRLNECTGLNVIFQLTDKCVLSCRYCFAKGAHGDVLGLLNAKACQTQILTHAVALNIAQGGIFLAT